MNFYTVCIIVVALFSVLYLYFHKPFYKALKAKVHPVTYENAHASLDRMEKWATWLTGLQTGAMAAIGFLRKGEALQPDLVKAAFLSLLFFGASIVLATWLLSALPSSQQRLKNTGTATTENDIYILNIFTFIPIRLGRFAGLIHTYFLLGIICFAYFVFQYYSAPK